MDASLQSCTPFLNLAGMSASAPEIYVPIGNDRVSLASLRLQRAFARLEWSIDSFLCATGTHLISFGPFVLLLQLRKASLSTFEANVRECYS